MLTYQNLGSVINSIDGLLKISSGGIFIPAMPKNNALYQMGHLGIEASKILTTLNAHIMYSTSGSSHSLPVTTLLSLIEWWMTINHQV